MTKREIKNGMILETNDGNSYMAIYIKGELYAIGQNQFMPLDTHNEDLTYGDDVLSIKKVYQPPVSSFGQMLNAHNPIWERKEVRKMTVAEICKELGYEAEIVK